MFRKNARAMSGKRPIGDLDERLAAYYGPDLPPHPLAEAAWTRLRDSLDQTRQLTVHRHSTVPPGLREAYADLLLQVDYRRPYPELYCHFSSRRVQPRVRGVPPGRRQVRLILPARSWQLLQAVELEVLLAIGLARVAEASRALYLCSRALFIGSLLLTLALLPFAGTDRRYLGICCLAFACCVAGLCLICWQERAQAFRGDLLAVQWLGRERVCRGLHLLAGHGCPGRSPAWGEPSLDERIARICGSSAKTKDEHLTLVG